MGAASPPELSRVNELTLIPEEVMLEDIELIAGTINLAGVLVLNLVIGAKGNGWRRRGLARRGFKHSQSVQAPSADAAIAQVTAAKDADEAVP